MRPGSEEFLSHLQHYQQGLSALDLRVDLLKRGRNEFNLFLKAQVKFDRTLKGKSTRSQIDRNMKNPV